MKRYWFNILYVLEIPLHPFLLVDTPTSSMIFLKLLTCYCYILHYFVSFCKIAISMFLITYSSYFHKAIFSPHYTILINYQKILLSYSVQQIGFIWCVQLNFQLPICESYFGLSPNDQINFLYFLGVKVYLFITSPQKLDRALWRSSMLNFLPCRVDVTTEWFLALCTRIVLWVVIWIKMISFFKKSGGLEMIVHFSI